MAKYGMSLCVLGHSGESLSYRTPATCDYVCLLAEFAQYGIGVNALWPRCVGFDFNLVRFSFVDSLRKPRAYVTTFACRTTIATAAVANLLGGAPLVQKYCSALLASTCGGSALCVTCADHAPLPLWLTLPTLS
jgi:hypothetical protein